MMKNTLQIFVAGSKDLEEERSWVRNVASNLDANYSGKGKSIHFIVKDYLNFELTFDTNGQQTNYNKYIAETADLVVFILDKNIGNITNQEFEVAYKAYSTERRPKICILSKKHNQSNANIDNMRRRVTQLNQYYNEYETKEQFYKKVEDLLRDCADPIIDKALSRKKNNVILMTLALALLVIVGVFIYLNIKTPTIKEIVPQTTGIVSESVVKQSSANVAVAIEKQPVNSKPVSKTESVATPKPVGTITTTTTATTLTNPVSNSAPKSVETPQVEPSLEAKANQGDAASCYELAVKLQSGSGVAKDVDRAFYYMKKAADSGYTQAYRPLAEMYRKGQGTTKNRDIAAEWYQRAADNGDRKALQILNNM